MITFRCVRPTSFVYARETLAGLGLAATFSFTAGLRFSSSYSSFRNISRVRRCYANYSTSNPIASDNPVSDSENVTTSGIEDELVRYVMGKTKATEVAHLVWKQVLRKGDTVVDATCGNGYDTLAMLRMVADESGGGYVYGLDIQRDALESTSSLLNECVNPKEKEHIKLFAVCHSRIEEVLPENASVRLVAFNLGYLPGGDKSIITKSETTLLALKASRRILMPGGLISLVVYVGHPGGREEMETVEGFATELPVDSWICCKFQMLNRPLAPVLVFLFKR